jgi:multidrug efflux pump subunit AcrB
MGSFLPLLLFIGGEFWPPLAIVLVGGVGGSTLLALFFTPAAYRLLLCSRSKATVNVPMGALAPSPHG